MKQDGALAWAAIDFLSALVLVVYVLISPPSKPVSVETFGMYAVTLSWQAKAKDDIDLWVQDPDGNIAWFGQPSAGLLHLEHDDLGQSGEEQGGRTVYHNGERTVLRGIVPGEYQVSVMCYFGCGLPVPATVELWSLRGDDRRVLRRRVVLRFKGDEQSGFRFTVNPAGEIAGTSDLPVHIVGVQPA